MILFKFVIFFLLAVFAGYGHSLDRRSHALRLLVIVLPTFTVVWLGGWGLIACVMGLLAGMLLYVVHRRREQRDRARKH
jgi:hypothetical protein